MKRKDVLLFLFEELPEDQDSAWEILHSSTDRNYLPLDFWPQNVVSNRRAWEIREISLSLEADDISTKEI